METDRKIFKIILKVFRVFERKKKVLEIIYFELGFKDIFFFFFHWWFEVFQVTSIQILSRRVLTRGRGFVLIGGFLLFSINKRVDIHGSN